MSNDEVKQHIHDVIYNNVEVFYMSFRDNIGDNIKYYLDKLNMSQKDLADKVGTKPGAVSKWINKTQAPDIELMPKVCEALNISLEDLFGIKSDTVLSNEELELLKAYKEHPEMQEAIKTLLKIN